MKYVASVKYENEIMIVERDYPTKKAFETDLRCNGFKIRFIATEETFDNECYKYYEKLEQAKRIAKLRRDSRKEVARRIQEMA